MNLFRLLLLAISLFTGSLSFADQVYTHPSGVQFRYPDGWTIRDSAFADFEMVPQDTGSESTGTMESYFQWTFLFEPSEEKITKDLELLIPRVVPFLKRAGEIEHLENPKGAMSLSWNGKSEDGQDVWARVFVIPGKDMTIALIAIGEKSRIETREKAIRDIVATYQFGAGKRDTALQGNWGSTVNEACGNGNLVGTSTITSSLYVDASGTFQMTESARFGCGVDAEGKTGDYDDAFDGIWFAGDGKLFLVSSQNMSMTFSYELQGATGSRALNLVHGTGRSQILNEKPE